MKRIFRWLETRLPRSESPNPSDPPVASENVKPDESDLDQGSPTSVEMPDIYGDEYVATVPNLKILDESSPDTDNSTGFNPYDTATMHKK